MNTTYSHIRTPLVVSLVALGSTAVPANAGLMQTKLIIYMDQTTVWALVFFFTHLLIYELFQGAIL